MVVFGVLGLAGCGNTSVEAAGGPITFSGTATLASGTTIAAGSCATVGIGVTGATTSMAVLVTPAGDPQQAGLTFPMLFSGFVDAADHVTVKVCKIATPNVTSTANVSLNVRVIG